MTERTSSVVLGVSAMRHDSSAAVLIDGALRAAVEEDRLTGVKHIGGWPIHATEAVLKQTGIAAADVDLVGDNLHLPTLLTLGARDLFSEWKASGHTNTAIRFNSFISVARNSLRRAKHMRAQFPRAARLK